MSLIDISPRIDCTSPVYPGDVSLCIRTLCEKPAKVTAFEMTPHLGAHVDAPSHLGAKGDVADLPLDLFVGDCLVIDCTGVTSIKPCHLPERVPERVLFKTGFVMVRLIGIDSPSIDPEDEKLKSHHRAIDAQMVILENLRLTEVEPGFYRLIALPLAIAGLEASPVRAILEK